MKRAENAAGEREEEQKLCSEILLTTLPACLCDSIRCVVRILGFWECLCDSFFKKLKQIDLFRKISGSEFLAFVSTANFLRMISKGNFMCFATFS